MRVIRDAQSVSTRVALADTGEEGRRMCLRNRRECVSKVLGVVGDGLREASEFGLEPSFHRTDWLLRWGLSIAYNFMTPKSLSGMLSFWVLK